MNTGKLNPNLKKKKTAVVEQKSIGLSRNVMKDIQDLYAEFDRPTELEQTDEIGESEEIGLPNQKKDSNGPATTKSKESLVVNKNSKTPMLQPSQQPLTKMVQNRPQIKILSKTPLQSNKNNANIGKPSKLSSNSQVKQREFNIGKKVQEKAPIQLTEIAIKVEKLYLETNLKPLHQAKVCQNGYELSSAPNLQPTIWSNHTLNPDPNEKPASQICQNPKIKFQFDARTICQGQLGNCYFITSLGSLCQNMNLLKRRIPQFEKYTDLLKSKKEPIKSFKVNLFQSGKLMSINVENSFKNIYSKPVYEDITCLILEKAYAQIYGNYDVINMGHAIDAARDLSGNVAEYIDLKDVSKAKEEIIKAFQSSDPMVIASKTAPPTKNISGKHSFNVLSYSIQKDQLFLQLRDPRGWSKADFQAPVSLKEKSQQNGEFWIGLNQLKDNFEVISVSRHLKNSFYNYKTFSLDQLEKGQGIGSIKFTLDSESKVGFSIHQKHKKFFGQKYAYRVICLMICSVDSEGNLIECLKTNFNCLQTCSILLDKLKPGNYVLTGQMYLPTNTKATNNNNLYFKNQMLTLSINSQVNIESSTLIKKLNLQSALCNYISNHKQEFQTLITKENLHRFHGSLFGKVCIYYENRSNKTVMEQLNYVSENIKITESKVQLKKGQTTLLMHPIGATNNCSHKCGFKSRTFYK